MESIETQWKKLYLKGINGNKGRVKGMGEYVNKTMMIDSDTGEIMKEKSWVGYDGFSDTGYKYRSRQTHIKYFFDSLPEALSMESLLLLVMIAEVMTEDNVLVYKVERKSRFKSTVYMPYDKEEIRQRTRFTYGINKFDRCWRELNKHCLKQVRYYQYRVWAVNPAVINKCKEIPFWLCDEFKDYMHPHMTAASVKKMQQKIDNLD